MDILVCSSIGKAIGAAVLPETTRDAMKNAIDDVCNVVNGIILFK
jgi:hypothetical protein